jgi:hypothetical protein
MGALELEDELEKEDEDDRDDEDSDDDDEVDDEEELEDEELTLWAKAAGIAVSPMELATIRARSFFIDKIRRK